jgi:hypothetical protein
MLPSALLGATPEASFVPVSGSIDRFDLPAARGLDWGAGWAARLEALERLLGQVVLEILRHEDLGAVIECAERVEDLPSPVRRRLRAVGYEARRLAQGVVERALRTERIGDPAHALVGVLARRSATRGALTAWFEECGPAGVRRLLTELPGCAVAVTAQRPDRLAVALTRDQLLARAVVGA